MLKSINDETLTNFVLKEYGPQVYFSAGSDKVISMPLIFPERTSFEFILGQGDVGNVWDYDGYAYITIIETNK